MKNLFRKANKWRKAWVASFRYEMWEWWTSVCFHHVVEGYTSWGEFIIVCIGYRIWMHIIEPDAVIFMTLGF